MSYTEYHKCKGHPDVRHVDHAIRGRDCNGQLMIDGDGWVQLPTGFGFRGSKFVVDGIRYPAYSGACLKCGAKGMFVRVDKKGKQVTKTPRAINRRIRDATTKKTKKI